MYTTCNKEFVCNQNNTVFLEKSAIIQKPIVGIGEELNIEGDMGIFDES